MELPSRPSRPSASVSTGGRNGVPPNGPRPPLRPSTMPMSPPFPCYCQSMPPKVQLMRGDTGPAWAPVGRPSQMMNTNRQIVSHSPAAALPPRARCDRGYTAFRAGLERRGRLRGRVLAVLTHMMPAPAPARSYSVHTGRPCPVSSKIANCPYPAHRLNRPSSNPTTTTPPTSPSPPFPFPGHFVLVLGEGRASGQATAVAAAG